VTRYRVFFAIEMPAEIQEIFAKIIFELKKSYREDAVRWTQPKNLHLTLQFLKAVAVEDIPQLSSKVRHALQAAASFTVRTGNLELFPSAKRPKIISLAVDASENLTNLSAMIGTGIKAANYPLEPRAFRAHLTLGYLNFYPGKKYFLLPEISLPTLPEIRAEKIVLLRSEPAAGGSHYTLLESFSLR
jgi:RNA 2',3'-cyclic 3'-phosphodiesterase